MLMFGVTQLIAVQPLRAVSRDELKSSRKQI